MGPFSKAFAIVNRIFGWALVVFGALITAGAIQRLLLGRFAGFGLGWHFLVGATCLAIGIVYIRAPLTRDSDGKRPRA